MDYSKVEMAGRLTAEALSGSVPYEEGKIYYSETDYDMKYGNPVLAANISLIDIPRNSIVLLESNTSVIGYSLLTDQDDNVIYITRGSSAGGEAGGTQKIAGDWNHVSHSHTMQNHTHSLAGTHAHTLSSHWHSISLHTHQWSYYVSANYTYSYDAGGNLVRLQDYGMYHGTGFIINAGNLSASGLNHYVEGSSQQAAANNQATDTAVGSSLGPSTNTSGSGVTPNTWRPTGRNFTRQQRA